MVLLNFVLFCFGLFDLVFRLALDFSFGDLNGCLFGIGLFGLSCGLIVL